MDKNKVCMFIPYILVLLVLLTCSDSMEPQRKSTLVDLPYFNATADREFLWSSVEYEQKYYVLKLAHFGSMRSRKQRWEAMAAFTEKYSFNFTNEFLYRKVFDSNLGDVTQALYIPHATILARQIHRAINGLGTDENTLTDIMCCVDPEYASMPEIRKEYKRMYGNEMHDDVLKDTGGIYKEMLLALILRDRFHNTNADNAKRMATRYKNDAQLSEFNTGSGNAGWLYFVESSYEEIRLATQYYHELTQNKSYLQSYLEKASSITAQNVFSMGFWKMFPAFPLFGMSHFQDLLISIVDYSENKTQYYLNLMRKGMRDDDRMRLSRVIGLHADTDFGIMKDLYKSQNPTKRLEELFLQLVAHHGDIDRHRILLARIIEGNTHSHRDDDWIRAWEAYEESIRPKPPKCYLGTHFCEEKNWWSS